MLEDWIQGFRSSITKLILGDLYALLQEGTMGTNIPELFFKHFEHDPEFYVRDFWDDNNPCLILATEQNLRLNPVRQILTDF